MAENEQQRWRMNRVGIFNFWYYLDQEIQLEDGRLILRGANGSGKSVTMQSFLPLVLDGDKRPHRLDPFGSKDRRIEYYLLGENDSGKQDVTGYLWMEFFHPGKQLFKTIGIGLRARRGAAQVSFWGFVIEDGRRINQDFWLYNRPEWVEIGAKVPLGRRELAEKIASGGQVVQEQAAYRDMVNKTLFGFADTDGYQDLLQLLVRLRSPKLSKEFKPTSMYEILASALPPLQDDDLRPLSEVLEDMDQITDRLEELRIHRRDMARLQEQYDRYNQFQLYTASGRVLEREGICERQAAEVGKVEREHQAACSSKAEAEQALAAVKQRQSDVETELGILEKHEAIEKQREYETSRGTLRDKEKQLEFAQAQTRQTGSRLDRVRQEEAASATKAQKQLQEQTGLLDELEGLAQDMEFVQHAVYHRNWSGGVPMEDQWREPWKRDIRSHREALNQALALARKEREAYRQVQEIERQLGEAAKEREGAEVERGKMEARLEDGKDEYRDRIVQWRSGLALLPLSDEGVRRALAAVREFGPALRDTEAFRRPVLEAWEMRKDELLRQRGEWLQREKAWKEQQEKISEEKRSWETNRDPEPVRTQARARSRAGRGAGQGAPLYTVCDFQSHLSEEEKARLEDALEQAGLLDAWIYPDGRMGKRGEAEEEAWIIPAPHEIGYTLADLLEPVVPEDSGLKRSMIDAVLRTFLWEEDGAELAGFALAGIGAGGHYRLGPLAGKAAGKTRAAYIGHETRKRTRQLEIARLEAELEAIAQELRVCADQLEETDRRLAQVKQEAASFPDSAALQAALDGLINAEALLSQLLKVEERMEERVKAKTSEWRQLQLQLHEATSEWSGLKREEQLQQGLSSVADYEQALSELHTAWIQHREAMRQQAQLQEQAAELQDTLEAYQEMQDELSDDCRRLSVQVDKLRQLIEELGLAEIAYQLESLKQEKLGLQEKEKGLYEERSRADRQEAALEERLKSSRISLTHYEQEKLEAWSQWHSEMKRGLLRDWADSYGEASAPAQLRKLCREIQDQYAPSCESKNPDRMANSLLEEYNQVRLTLADYVLEAEVEDTTGRIVLLSMRNRNQPHAPRVVLEELLQAEEEQSQLLSERDKELYEEIILRSVGKAIRQKIHRAEQWVKQMNRLMEERNTSSGLRLKLEWIPRPAQNESQLDTERLVELMKRDSHRLHEVEIEQIITHFRSHIGYAKHRAGEEQESLRKHLYEVLDYRNWFVFELKYAKGEQTAYRPLTDSRFNVLSGGEKAMAMYIPLFAATYSRYSDGRPDAPRIISLDEAFAGVDEENMKDMFQLLTEMDFDYMMTSQVLWGCYDTVPKLSIYEVHRPKDADWVTLFHYRWNGRYKEFVQEEAGSEVGA
ncbi:TIGR02680 family protein [Paenibacillus sp. YN15]|uniref:TIGR02680 family protein n=1 Tax=Paenibacillus sp. YN15 TaxID=1742774 RepID=UPI000DCDD90A|nr:TIGR02680 family protein [Paenibacillus sp. YN15]RAU92833.1 TIGR02680 family protein [Paenibacillus sp. YN15]